MTALSNSLLKCHWDQHISHCYNQGAGCGRWFVRLRLASAQDKIALAAFIHHEKKLSILPQVDCSVCPMHPKHTEFLFPEGRRTMLICNRTWFSRHGGVGLTVGLDPRGLFQP